MMLARFVVCSLVTILVLVLPGSFSADPSNEGAWAAADISNVRPIKGVSYEPAPSDDTQLQKPPFNEFNSGYYDTDFYNSDFVALRGVDGATDLTTDQNVGAKAARTT